MKTFPSLAPSGLAPAWVPAGREAAPAACALCGMALLTAPVVVGGKAFCCDGCAGVFAAAEPSGIAGEVMAGGARDAHKARTQRRPATTFFLLKGMSCPGCGLAAERLLANQPGVLSASVSFAAERGRVRYDPGKADPAVFLKRLEGLGYTARPLGDNNQRRQQWMLIQLIAAAAFGMQVMGLSIVHLYPYYAAHDFDAPSVRAVQYLVWLMATPALFFGGLSFLRGAWRALRARTATMDTLVALGTLSAYGFSVAVTLIGGGEVYFDSVAMVTTLVMFGRYLETLGGDRARQNIRELLDLQPRQAWLRDDRTWREVPADSLASGDTILVKPGERVPADGEIVEGHAAVDELLLTGESVPVEKAPGRALLSGTLVVDGALVCRVSRGPGDTRLAQITRTVEETLANKAPIQRLADAVSAWFAIGVLAVAVLTFAIWGGLAGDVGKALLASVAVLVVACPCALGLATPFALSIGLGRATEAGVLVRDFAALESAATLRCILFDKTGTLTRGRLTVAGVRAEDGFSEESVLATAAAAEQFSEHPFAKAIVAADPGTAAPASDFEMVRGAGVSARLLDGSNRCIRVGSPGYVGVDPASHLVAETAARAAAGESIVWVGSGEVIGFIALRDEPNPTAAETIARLRADGIEVAMLSGDDARTTGSIAARLDLADAEGGLTPGEKLTRLRTRQAAGKRVGMVGDGINDAPALAAADLGIAVSGGTDIAGGISGLVLMRPDLRLIPWFLDLSRRSRRIIGENLFWAFLYNLVAVPLAAFGLITPIVAAAAMAASSLLVVGNSLRLRRAPPSPRSEGG